MRFKKGSKVEVLSRKAVPSGSWHCAEIVCGNGNDYTVRYDGLLDSTNGMIVERVSIKAIRPCPPQVEISGNWLPGDVIEVFDNFSWKMATILEVLGKKYILVRLLGSSLEFKVRNSCIRLRQSWQDDEWVVIRKGPGSYEDVKLGVDSTVTCNKKLSFVVQNRNERTVQCEKYEYRPDVNGCSFKTLKRELYSRTEDYAGSRQKYRAVEKDGRLHRVAAANPFMQGQVDTIAFPRNMWEGKQLRASHKNRINSWSEVYSEWRKPNVAIRCSFSENLESDDADSVTCSVGSCSIDSNNFCKSPSHVSRFPLEDNDGQFSDAESFCRLGDENDDSPLHAKEELKAEIHRLELHAYRCTMEALHASGPLSWGKEAMVTNLRLSLHISNDEHLMELRNLISAGNSFSSR